MSKLDIRTYKKDLRARMKAIRQEMPPALRANKDENIFAFLTGLREYREAKTLVTYVSTPIEVDTRRLIAYSLAHGKQVAVPRCRPNQKGAMDFFLIDSMEDLQEGTYRVLEPDPQKCKLATNFANSVCVVPGLSYDRTGYRIGYGGGYYDRFLSNYKGVKIGVIYTDCIKKRLIHGRYDIPVDIMITEKYIRNMHAPTRSKAKRIHRPPSTPSTAI